MQKYFYPIILLFVLFPFILEGASLIDINSASSEELQKIIGIGPVLSQRIIEGRPYNSLDDLIKVKGIGEKTLQK
ncbi:MAG: helix-hairpin-helix domain-containing protein, partial [Candidatus Pacebacteria bacterium]|nr:helix-hairpin-helix domain-containing protein [Candidatus Paceibacterota bacterium]